MRLTKITVLLLAFTVSSFFSLQASNTQLSDEFLKRIYDSYHPPHRLVTIIKMIEKCDKIGTSDDNVFIAANYASSALSIELSIELNVVKDNVYADIKIIEEQIVRKVESVYNSPDIVFIKDCLHSIENDEDRIRLLNEDLKLVEQLQNKYCRYPQDFLSF